MFHPPITRESLSSERESLGTAILLFESILKIDSYDSVYFAVEGEDDALYYRPRIQLKFQNINFIPCYSKENVIYFRNYIIKNKYKPKYNIGFLLDRDYDLDKDIPKDIYITPCYSIENFYCSKRAFRQILSDHFHIHESDTKYNELNKLSIKCYTKFIFAILDFHAWNICLREAGYKKVDLKHFTSDYLSISAQKIQKRYTISDLKKRYTDAPAIDVATLYKKKSMLRKNPRCYLRGKDLLNFTIIFIKYLIKRVNISIKNNNEDKKYTCKLQLSSENILSELSTTADSPYELYDYVSSLDKI